MEAKEPATKESYVLTCLPTVINIVLNGMTAQELNVCARVCRCWYSAVYVIKEKRQQRKLIKWLSVEVGDEKDDPALTNQIQDFFKSLYSEPAMLFLFCQSELSTHRFKVPAKSQSNRPTRAAKFEKLEFGDFVQSLLPKTCKFIGVATDGIIGTSSNLEKIQEVEGEKFMSFLCIPDIEGVEILTVSADIVQETITKFIPEEKAVKTILFFCDDPRCPLEISNTLRENYEGAVIAGGYIDNHIYPDVSHGDLVLDEELKPIYVSCVAFCGQNLSCASIVLEHNTHTPQQVEEKLLKLKSCGLPEEKSFAFMFACVARGRSFYQNENVESSIFKKHFPKTPLIGFFGNGEIGFTHLPNTPTGDTESQLKMEGKKSNKRLPKMHHSYSSVFCLVSIT